MSVIPVSSCRMIRLHFVLIVKFFLRFKFQENIITIALRAYPEAMGMQVSSIKAMWIVHIIHFVWAGGFLFRWKLVIEVNFQGFTLFDPDLRTN